MHFTIEHTIPMGREEYWRILHDREFEAFQARELKLKAYDEISATQEGDVVRRRVRVKPQAQLPETIKKLLASYINPDEIGYEEEQEKYLKDYYLKFRIHPPIFADRVRIAGVFSLQELDSSRCLRLLEGDIEISLFGIGRIVEKFILEELRRTYDKIPDIVRRWKEQQAWA